MAKELKNTILIDNKEYNINAVKADHVANALAIKSVGLGGTELANPVEFDGTESKEISVVPAVGGKFTGPIRVPAASVKNTAGKNNLKENGDFADEAVLNYSDIKETLLKQLLNTSVLYKYEKDDTDKFYLNPIVDQAVNGISVVVGPESKVTDFASSNFWSNNKLSSYFYVCAGNSESGNIYFGTSESSLATRLASKSTTLVGTYNSELKSYGADQIARNIKDISDLDTRLDSIINGGTFVEKANYATNAGSATNADLAREASSARNIYFSENSTISGESINTAINLLHQALYKNESTGSYTSTVKNARSANTSLSANAINVTYESGTETNYNSTPTDANITISFRSPSGGKDGDIWIKY